jgi:hypothetical protein
LNPAARSRTALKAVSLFRAVRLLK